MKDLEINRYTLPDWHSVKSLALVYPYKITGREHLVPFYKKLLALIPDKIEIILLVKDISCEKDISDYWISNGINNELEIMCFPDLFDIWIRDYAPLITEDSGMKFPVKFNYNPSYVDNKYSGYISNDNITGEELGKKIISEGIRSVYFNWDMGNLTHNGRGTAIISNRFIADNLSCNIKHELNPILNVFCGFNNVIYIPTEPGDKTGHVDGMVKFINEKTLAIGSYPRGTGNYKFMESLTNNLKKELGKEYTIIRLENGTPEDYKEEGIASAMGNHINFLRIEDQIFFPYYSHDISGSPLKAFRNELKNMDLRIKVIPVDIPGIQDLARSGGVLNCISWQVYD